MIKLKYSAALCGAGKTRWACGHTAQNLGRYLYAVDRRNVLSATKDLIETFARSAGTNPTIIELYSDSDDRKGGVSDVRRKVREAGCQYAAHPHVVVLVTHEALKSSDLSTYVSGWTCVIDEIPNIVSHTEVKMPVLSLLLQNFCNLKPIDNTGWSELRVKGGAPLMTDMYRDTFLSDFADLYRKIRHNNTAIKITAWADAAKQAPCSFVTLWNPAALAPFSEVYVLGNAFEHTITCKLFQRTFQREVKLQQFRIPSANLTPPKPRQLLIRYFASVHEAGSTFWQTEAGQECLRRIPWWVNSHTRWEDHYWSCNISTYPKREEMVGKWVSPKIAGENGLRHLTCGTFIYSAKPSDAEIETLKIFDISADEVVRSREHEDLIQMLWRSSLRDFGDGRPVEFRVYDQRQATFLRDFISKNAPHVTVTLEQIDLGLDVFERRKRGREKLSLTEAERLAKLERRRVQDCERQRRRRAKLASSAVPSRPICAPTVLTPPAGPSA